MAANPSKRLQSVPTLKGAYDPRHEPIAAPCGSQEATARICCHCELVIGHRQPRQTFADGKVGHASSVSCITGLKELARVLTRENARLRQEAGIHPDAGAYKAPRSKTR